MLAKTHCAAVQGIAAHAVEVEVNDGYGETLVVIVGLPDAAVRESRDRVIAARQLQEQRFDGRVHVTCNARMQARDIKQYCQLADEPKNLLRMAMDELNLSARAYDRILKVSRTIADLAGANAINSEHLSETLQYRTLDRQLWG